MAITSIKRETDHQIHVSRDGLTVMYSSRKDEVSFCFTFGSEKIDVLIDILKKLQEEINKE